MIYFHWHLAIKMHKKRKQTDCSLASKIQTHTIHAKLFSLCILTIIPGRKEASVGSSYYCTVAGFKLDKYTKIR